MRSRARASGTKQAELAKVAAIRAHVGPAAFRFTDAQLLDVAHMCGSVGLACDALAMIPRPRWLERMENEA